MMRITIIGFGNQAKAWSQNLSDSGFPIRVALRPGSPSFKKAQGLGFETVETGSPDFYSQEAFALLTPDHTHEEFMQEHGNHFKPGSWILYAHGFSMMKHQFQRTFPQVEHILFAPKSIGSELRNQFLIKGKLGAVYSLEHVGKDQVSTLQWLMQLAPALGINLGPYQTSFERETKADLYSEQGLLCSLIPYVASRMFNDMVTEGIEPELAYFECWHELKLIVAAMVEKGPLAFYDLISPNALVGSEKGFERLMDGQLEEKLKSLFDEIQDGTFNKELEQADVEALREKIRSRWSKDLLVKTFNEINEGKHEKA